MSRPGNAALRNRRRLLELVLKQHKRSADATGMEALPPNHAQRDAL
jgi:hypothetical protein